MSIFSKENLTFKDVNNYFYHLPNRATIIVTLSRICASLSITDIELQKIQKNIHRTNEEE